MININKAKLFYKEYISKYNPQDPKIAIKISHIYRVAEKAKNLAENLKLSEEDIKLAELIGLLHDIGRFEQVKNFNTFIDSDSIDHAEYGVKVLSENNLIRNFVSNKDYDNIIYKAIINHNKLKIEDGLNQRELLHAKIIRDADKLDIFYVITVESIEALYRGSNVVKKQITPEIYKQYINNHSIDYKDMKQGYDLLLAHLSYIFDINYKYTLIQIKENNYLEKWIQRFEFKNKITKEQMDVAYKEAKEYINNKLIEG